MPGEQPVEQGGTRSAHVQITGGRGRETDAWTGGTRGKRTEGGRHDERACPDVTVRRNGESSSRPPQNRAKRLIRKRNRRPPDVFRTTGPYCLASPGVKPLIIRNCSSVWLGYLLSRHEQRHDQYGCCPRCGSPAALPGFHLPL